MSKRGIATALVLGLVAAALAACSGSSKHSAPKTVVQTVVQSVTVAPPSASASDSGPATDGSVPGTDFPSDGGVSGPGVPSITGVVAPSRAGSVLTLDDFFQPDDSWAQAVVGVANKTGVPGIRGDVDGCGETPEDLSLRLSDQFQTLKFDAAQDNTSPSNSTTMVVTVLVNNHQVVAKQVPFNTIQPLSINVTSANAVDIQFTGDSCPDNGSSEFYPVMFNAILG